MRMRKEKDRTTRNNKYYIKSYARPLDHGEILRYDKEDDIDTNIIPFFKTSDVDNLTSFDHK